MRHKVATAKAVRRRRVLAEANEAPELLPQIEPADVEAAEHAGDIKVHFELPDGEVRASSDHPRHRAAARTR
jgi:hypothetical protein